MNRADRELSERLLDVESYDSELRKKYEQEIRAMLERELSPLRKVMLGGTAVFGASSAALCGWLAIVENLPPLARAGLGVGSLFGVAWAAVAVTILRRGKFVFATDARRMASMVWVFTLLMVVFFMLIAGTMDDKSMGILMVLNGLVFLVGAAVCLVNYKVEAAERATRQKLLEIEMRLAELGERR